MTNEEFRKAYFEQYADDGEVLSDEWFQSYFAEAEDWMDVEPHGEGAGRSTDDGYTVYSDQNSAIGGYWGTNSWGTVEGPFETVREVVAALGMDSDPFEDDLNEDAFEDEDDEDLGTEDEDDAFGDLLDDDEVEDDAVGDEDDED
jgi:hypothetical protein